MTKWLSDRELAAWHGLLQTTDHLRDVLNRQLLETSGVSLADYEVLGRVAHSEGGARVRDLTATLAWEQSRISHQLTRLTKAGYVAREQCDEDRRGSRFTLTDRGRELLASAAPGHVDAVRALFFDRIDPEMVDQLTKLSAVVSAPQTE